MFFNADTWPAVKARAEGPAKADLARLLNEFFKASYEGGALQLCAEKYGVQAALIEQK